MSQIIDLNAWIETALARTPVLLDVQRDCVADATAPGISAALGNCRSALRHARSAGLQVGSIWVVL
jgi:hypothetical protein